MIWGKGWSRDERRARQVSAVFHAALPTEGSCLAKHGEGRLKKRSRVFGHLLCLWWQKLEFKTDPSREKPVKSTRIKVGVLKDCTLDSNKGETKNRLAFQRIRPKEKYGQHVNAANDILNWNLTAWKEQQGWPCASYKCQSLKYSFFPIRCLLTG